MEFFLVAPLFLFSIFACIAVSVWSIESEAAVSLAEQAARVASSGFGSGTAENLPPGASAAILSFMRSNESGVFSGFFDTQVTASAGGVCGGGYYSVPQPAGGSRLEFCVWQTGFNTPGSAVSLPIHVRIYGYVTDFVPPMGFAGRWGKVPIDVGVQTQSLFFSQ